MPSSSKAFFLSFCNVIFLWFQLPVIFNCCFVLRSSSCGFLFQWVWKLCCPTFSPFFFYILSRGGSKILKYFFVKFSRHLRQFGTLSFFHLVPNLLGTHYGRLRGEGVKNSEKSCHPTFSPFPVIWSTFNFSSCTKLFIPALWGRRGGGLLFFHLEPNLLGTHYGWWWGGGSKKLWKILSSTFLTISSYLELF